jgi:hypothetical protein
MLLAGLVSFASLAIRAQSGLSLAYFTRFGIIACLYKNCKLVFVGGTRRWRGGAASVELFRGEGYQGEFDS